MSEFVAVCHVDDVEPGYARLVYYGDERVALCRLESGEYLAIGDVCTHEESHLSEGEVEDDSVYCPKHGARFDLRTGKALTLPEIYPEPVYEVEVVDDQVRIMPKAQR